MGKLVILQLLSGNFARGFLSTLQIKEDGDTTAGITQMTGRLPAAAEMPQRLNDEWRQAFDFNDGRIRPRRARVTHFSRSDLVNNFVGYLNDWLNNSGDLKTRILY